MGSVIGSNASVSVEGSFAASRGACDCLSAALADPELIRLLRRSSVSFFSSLDTSPLSVTTGLKRGRTRHSGRFHRVPRRGGTAQIVTVTVGTGSDGWGVAGSAEQGGDDDESRNGQDRGDEDGVAHERLGLSVLHRVDVDVLRGRKGGGDDDGEQVDPVVAE